LIGLRLGASLAVQAAADHSVENLILWEPVVKGRRYVREMQALSLTAANQPQPIADAPDLIEAGGFVLTKQTVEDVGRIDLLTVQPKCSRVLIVVRDDMPEDSRLRDAWLGLGLDVQQIRQPGYAAMMAEPHQTKVPEQAIGRIVHWLRSDLPFAAGGAPRALLPATQCELPGISERLLRLSQEPNLFGILSEPKEDAAQHRPLIILTNAGSAYRVGPNRLHVLLARHLAAQGFRVLRLDLCGLGDSVTTDPSNENHPYTATAFRDLNLTLQYARLHLGVTRAVLMGLCSGAYMAFQAAASFADPMLVESVLINPLTFFWKDAMADETPSLQAHRRRHYYWQAILQPSKWWRFLTGKTQIRIGGAVRLLIDRFISAKDADAATAECEPDYPVADDLERVARAGRHLALFISDSDPGYSILTFHAKKMVSALRKARMLDVAFIPNADHTFSASMRRREVIQLIAAHLLRRYPIAD
jgi:pimeloyl-ACP methyl ester carboxylesterase